MKTSLHVRTSNEFADLAAMAKAQRDRYASGSALWSFYDGKMHAYRDLCLSVRNGDFSPFDDAPTDKEAA